MTVTCPEGHRSQATDYCDTCGTPIAAASVSSGSAVGGASGLPGSALEPDEAEPVATVTCPHCGGVNVADALFCEACGYDFTTGTPPLDDNPGPVVEEDEPEVEEPEVGEPEVEKPEVEDPGVEDPGVEEPEVEDPGVEDPEVGEPDGDDPDGEACSRQDPPLDESQTDGPGSEEPETGRPGSEEAQTTESDVDEPEFEAPDADGPAGEEPETEKPETDGPHVAAVQESGDVQPEEPEEPEEPEPEAEPAPTVPGPPPAREVTPQHTRPRHTPPSRALADAWVVEVWVDPDWYAVQQTAEACPSTGVPDIVVVRRNVVLVGRPSGSLGVRPDVDGGADSAVSRQHAQLTSDGRRWWIEDLGSSNGTFVGEVGEPLPTTPLTPGVRVEIDRDDRIYVGAWTRLVVRQATASEQAGHG